jgi:hypothetical protein
MVKQGGKRMDTKLITACDGVWKAMFRAEFTKEEVETLRALKRLIDSTIGLYEKREEGKE